MTAETKTSKPSLAEIKPRLTPVLKRYGVVRAAVFGSVARGEAAAESDLDLLIEYQKGMKKTFDAYLELKGEVEKLSERKVELVQFDLLHPFLKDEVYSEKVDIL